MRPLRLPFRQAAPKIALDAGGGLVALLGGLGEQLHDDRRDAARNASDPLAGRHRLPRDVAVHPLHRIGGRERQRPGEHLVERDAERVEIAAGIDRPVHPAGLLGRHVGERAGDDLGRRGRLALARQARGDAEAGEPDLAVAASTRMLAGLMSLWMRPRWWTWPSAAASAMARRRKRVSSSGRRAADRAARRRDPRAPASCGRRGA